MKHKEARAHEALAQIAQIAASVTAEGAAGAPPARSDGKKASGAARPQSCSIKALPTRLHMRAAQTAIKVNPVNAPLRMPLGRSLGIAAPLRLTIDTGRYWGPSPRMLTVSFMETAPADLRARIVSHLNAWTLSAGISFTETAGTGQVRISREPGGYYSYLGTDVLLIPPGHQTMNLEAFTMSTPDSEFMRVVRHEAGHTLGFPHEHMRAELVDRIDPQRAYDYFWRTQGWDQQTVDEQVLTPLDEESIFGTPADQTSIMCYQLPGEITRDGEPIVGGDDINATDYAFAATVYPKLSFFPDQLGAQESEDDWSEAEDVAVPV